MFHLDHTGRIQSSRRSCQIAKFVNTIAAWQQRKRFLSRFYFAFNSYNAIRHPSEIKETTDWCGLRLAIVVAHTEANGTKILKGDIKQVM